MYSTVKIKNRLIIVKATKLLAKKGIFILLYVFAIDCKKIDVVSVTSLVGFWRAFLKPKVGGADHRHVASHSRIIENGQKGGTWMKLSWNHARL